MSTLSISINDCLGNTLKAAAREVFGLKRTSDVKTRQLFHLTIASVWNGSEWVDYQAWEEGGVWNFLKSE